MQVAAVSIQLIAVISVSVLIWLTCAFYAGSIARNNGGSYDVWFLVGFLFGLIGLLVAYIYFRSTSERRKHYRHSVHDGSGLPEMIHCPRCNQLIPSSFDCCQFCGEILRHKKRHHSS